MQITGYRGLAYKRLGDISQISKQHEVGMTFLDLLVFFDPPKAGVIEALDDLRKLGITLKLITVGSRSVPAHFIKHLLNSLFEFHRHFFISQLFISLT